MAPDAKDTESGSDRRIPLAMSVSQLTGRIFRSHVLTAPSSRSGSRVERVWTERGTFVVKRASRATTWIMRTTDDDKCRAIALWRTPLPSLLPPWIHGAQVGAVLTSKTGRYELVMHDVGENVLALPAGRRVTVDVHRKFLRLLAAMHAAWIDPPSESWQLSLDRRITFLSPSAVEEEPDVKFLQEVSRAWRRMSCLPNDVRTVVRACHESPGPLAAALDGLPLRTLLHGDLKLDNVALFDSKTAAVLDWEMCGPGPAVLDLTFHLWIDAARLPLSKDDAIKTYRLELERYGVRTGGWWDDAMGLAALATIVQLGWERLISDGTGDLTWWMARARPAIGLL